MFIHLEVLTGRRKFVYKKGEKNLHFDWVNFFYIYTSVDATVKYIILREINLSCF